ncbi:MAG TPA: glycosyltransferase family 4 protein [Patescibacteria group bacterium]|nr:glycosyltransferase family 4 protein [Patescibacteria group bacterium]
MREKGLHHIQHRLDAVEQQDDFWAQYGFIMSNDCDGSETEKNHNQLVLPANGKLVINWALPALGPGSGGHLNILRLVKYLETFGHQNCLYFVHPPEYRGIDEDDLRKAVKAFYDIELKTTRLICGGDEIMDSHATLASSWQTAYFVRRFSRTVKKFYFIQDFEPYFFPRGGLYHLAANTYNFGFHGITAGGWLADKLQREFGMPCDSIGFAYEADLYQKVPMPQCSSKPKVLYYARPTTERRAFEIAVLALYLLKQRLPEAEVHFVGGDTSSYQLPFEVAQNYGSVSLQQLPEIYSSVDVALVLSATNLSLLPLEILACGTPVVMNRGGNTEWLGEHFVFADFSPEAIADALEQYLTNAGLRQQMILASQDMLARLSWEEEARKVEDIIKRQTAK